MCVAKFFEIVMYDKVVSLVPNGNCDTLRNKNVCTTFVCIVKIMFVEFAIIRTHQTD